MSFNVQSLIDRDSALWQALRAWPKIELHRHLEGSIRLPTLIDVRLAPGQTLTRNQVRGITNLVAGAVPELKPDNVAVVDQTGKLLSETVEVSASVALVPSVMQRRTRWGMPLPTKPCTSSWLRGGRPSSVRVRFAASARSTMVSSRVPSRSNSTQRGNRPMPLTARPASSPRRGS